MEENPIYSFMKANNLTTKDEATFMSEYSDVDKSQELWSFMNNNKLTEKPFDAFYGEYFEKKKPTGIVKSEPLTVAEGATLAGGQSFGPGSQELPTKNSMGTIPSESTPKEKVDLMREKLTLMNQRNANTASRIELKRGLNSMAPEIDAIQQQYKEYEAALQDASIR